MNKDDDNQDPKGEPPVLDVPMGILNSGLVDDYEHLPPFPVSVSGFDPRPGIQVKAAALLVERGGSMNIKDFSHALVRSGHLGFGVVPQDVISGMAKAGVVTLDDEYVRLSTDDDIDRFTLRMWRDRRDALEKDVLAHSRFIAALELRINRRQYPCGCVRLNEEIGIHDLTQQQTANRVGLGCGLVGRCLSADAACEVCRGTGKLPPQD